MPVAVYESLDDLPQVVAETCSYPRQSDFFISLDWFRCLYDGALRGELTPRVYVLSDDADVPQAVLFCAQPNGHRTLVSLNNYYSMAWGPVMLGTLTIRDALGRLADHILTERPRWHTVDWRLLPGEAWVQANAATALRDAGCSVETYHQFDNWYLPVGGQSFDTYYAARPSRLRNTVKRKEKKLRADHAVEIRVHTADDEALGLAVDDWTAIYNSSWKNPEPYPDFIPTLCRTAARLGLLRLGVLHVDNEAAAAQLWINTPHKALIYKLAYREEFAKQSVGSILSRELFRIAIDEDRVAEIDYGVGSEAYKQEWMTDVRQLTGVHACNPRTLSGIGCSLRAKTKRLLRRFTAER